VEFVDDILDSVGTLTDLLVSGCDLLGNSSSLILGIDNDLLYLGGGLLRFLSQCFDLVRDDREPITLFASAGSLDTCVECQQIGLISDIADYLKCLTDLLLFLIQAFELHR
jgi:hypothetical protein